MIENLKYRILSGWSFLRLLRLGLSTLIIYQAIMAADWMVGTLGGLLFLQSAFNYGCCSTAGSCNSYNTKDSDDEQEITFEEIKSPVSK